MNTKRYRKLRKRKTRRIMRGGNLMSLFTGPRAPRIKFARPGSVLSLSQVLYLCRKKCNEMELSKNTNIFKKCNKETGDSEQYQIIGRILMDRGFETRIKRIEPDVEKTEAQDWCDNIKIAEFGKSELEVPVEVIQVPPDPTTLANTPANTPAPRPDNTPDPSRPANTPDPSRPDNTPANTPPPRPPPINPKPSNLKPVLKKNSTSNDCTLIHIPDKDLKNNAFLLRSIENYKNIIGRQTNKNLKAFYQTRLECFKQKLIEFHQNVTKKHI